MKNWKHWFAGVLLMLVTSSHLTAQSDKIKRIDSLMQEEHKRGLFSGNVLVTDHQKVLYQSSLGYADAAKKTKLDAGFLFNIGSIAKEFNGVSIMVLKEQGKLSLDDKVSKFFPELPSWADTISIRNLLQYTSGLPEVKWRTVQGDADIWKDLQAMSRLDFEPGTQYAYNNMNTFLQRRIVEKVSGMPFNRFVKVRLLRPAGMKASVVDPAPDAEHLAKSFNNEGKEDTLQYKMTGWTFVTIGDFYKWTRALQTNKLISKGSWIELGRAFAKGRQSNMGELVEENGVIKEHIHHGTSFNYEALLYSDLSVDVNILLVTNNKNFKVFLIKDAINAILKDEPHTVPER